MESNLNSIDNLQEIVNRNEKVISTRNINYLYPNGHRTTHQMMWFKDSCDRGLRSDIAAWSRQWELLFIYANDMRKTKINNPEPYEDLLRLQKLDPYEAQIKSSDILKQNDKPIE